MGTTDLRAALCTLTPPSRGVVGDINKPVKFTGNDTVALLTSGDDLGGVVRTIEPAGDVCAVQLTGAVTLPYTGTAPTIGYQRLVSSATIGSVIIASAAAGSPLFRITYVDTAAVTVTFILD
jgi:hypothetical protein